MNFIAENGRLTAIINLRGSPVRITTAALIRLAAGQTFRRALQR